MKKLTRFFIQLLHQFWQLLAVALILCALIVQLGRMALPVVADYRQQLADYVSNELGLQVSIGELAGRWESLLPALAIESLVVRTPDGKVVLEVESALAEIDLLQSALDARLRFTAVEFAGVRSNFVEGDDGKFRLEGLASNEKNVVTTEVKRSYSLDDLRGIFLVGRNVRLMDFHTQITLLSGHQVDLIANQISLEHGQGKHRLTAAIQLDDRAEAIELIMEGSGDPFDMSEFGSNAYLKIEQFPTEKLLALVAKKYWQGLPQGQWRSDGHASVELWLTMTPARGLDWVGNMSLQGLPFEIKTKQLPFQSLATNIAGHSYIDGDWQLQLQNISVDWIGQSTAPFSLQLSADGKGQIAVRADRIELAQWHAWLSASGFLPKKFQSLINTLKPRGEIHNLLFSWPSESLQDFQLAANLYQVGVNAWRGAPAVTQVDGYVESRAQSGFVELDSSDGFSMHYTKVYERPMAYQAARGQVAWWLQPQQQSVFVNSGPIHFSGEDGEATGFVYIDGPLGRKDKTMELLLQIGIENSAAKYHKKYVPSVVSPNLLKWLDTAVTAGDVRAGGFIFHGFVGAKGKPAPSIQLWLDIANASLDYKSPWPVVSGVEAQLVLDDQHLQVSATKGSIYQSTLRHANVELRSDEQNEKQLLIDGELFGPLTDAHTLLQQSPLADITNRSFESWQMQGNYESGLRLAIPMSVGAPGLAYNVDVSLEDSTVTLPSVRLEASQLNGGLAISNVDGLVIKKLKGILWGEPVAITSALSGDGSRLQVNISAKASTDNLLAWSGFEPLPQLLGSAKVNARVDLPWAGGGTATASNNSKEDTVQAVATVTLNSDLVGVSFLLPPPLNKSAAQILPMQVSLPLTKEDLVVSGTISEIVDAKLMWRRDNDGAHFDRGAVQLFGAAKLPEQSAFMLGANLARVDLKQWLAAVEGNLQGIQTQPQADVETPPSLPLYIAVHAQDVIVDGEHSIGETHLEALKRPQRWYFHLRNERLMGSVEVPLQAGERLDVSLSYLRLPLWPKPAAADVQVGEQELELAKQQAAEKLWKILQPLPPLQVAVAQIFVDEVNAGMLSFDSRIEGDTLVVEGLSGSLHGLAIGSQDTKADYSGAGLTWNHREARTYFQGRLMARDLGEVMTAFDNEKLIESDTARFDVDMTWPGDPSALDLVHLDGEVDFIVSRGRFLRANTSAGNALMRLMGIFNFDTWIRRLQLDFSDVYNSGMAYDEVKGVLKFSQGKVDMSQPVVVKTPSSKMQMSGLVNLRENTIDSRLTVNLPVFDNLTFIAAVSAGLPVAAGVFVASKLFEKQFDAMTSVNYRVSGSLDKPSMEFRQATEGKRAEKPVTKPSKKPVAEPASAIDPANEPSLQPLVTPELQPQSQSR